MNDLLFVSVSSIRAGLGNPGTALIELRGRGGRTAVLELTSKSMAELARISAHHARVLASGERRRAAIDDYLHGMDNYRW